MTVSASVAREYGSVSTCTPPCFPGRHEPSMYCPLNPWYGTGALAPLCLGTGTSRTDSVFVAISSSLERDAADCSGSLVLELPVISQACNLFRATRTLITLSPSRRGSFASRSLPLPATKRQNP